VMKRRCERDSNTFASAHCDQPSKPDYHTHNLLRRSSPVVVTNRTDVHRYHRKRWWLSW
jgi:hypothetical protein